MAFSKSKFTLDDITGCFYILMYFFMLILVCAGIVYAISLYFFWSEPPQDQWGGNYPGRIYTVYDKDTGVYYAITEKGGITPMYTIEGEVKLVDQGNEYVVHKNLGEPPHAQEQ